VIVTIVIRKQWLLRLRLCQTIHSVHISLYLLCARL